MPPFSRPTTTASHSPTAADTSSLSSSFHLHVAFSSFILTQFGIVSQHNRSNISTYTCRNCNSPQNVISKVERNDMLFIWILYYIPLRTKEFISGTVIDVMLSLLLSLYIPCVVDVDDDDDAGCMLYVRSVIRRTKQSVKIYYANLFYEHFTQQKSCTLCVSLFYLFSSR